MSMFIKTEIELKKLIELLTLEGSEENLVDNKSTCFFQVVKATQEKGTGHKNKVEIAVNNTDIPSALLVKLLKIIGHWREDRQQEELSKPDFQTTLRVLADVQNLGRNLPLSTDDEPYPEFMHRILDDPHDRTIGYQWLRNILVALANTNENEFQHLIASPPCNGSEYTARFAEMTQFFFTINPPLIFKATDSPAHLIDLDIALLLHQIDRSSSPLLSDVIGEIFSLATWAHNDELTEDRFNSVKDRIASHAKQIDADENSLSLVNHILDKFHYRYLG